MFEIIPAIDLLDGQVVRLTQGDYEAVQRYDGIPADIARRYADHGATRIHIVDLNGAKEGVLVNQAAIESIRAAVDCRLELGGGIRNLAMANRVFSVGIQYIILGSLLVKDWDMARMIIGAFPGRILAGLDAKNGHLATDGWVESSGESVGSFIQHLNGLSLSGIIYTDIATDGMMSGPSLDQLRHVCEQTQLPVIASGGIRNLSDIQSVRDIPGISGCIIGKAVLSGELDLSTVWQ